MSAEGKDVYPIFNNTYKLFSNNVLVLMLNDFIIKSSKILDFLHYYILSLHSEFV